MALQFKSAALRDVVGRLRAWEGFESFDNPGEAYLSIERDYKVEASRQVRALFDRDVLRTEVEAGDVEALRGRLERFQRESGFSNMLSWLDLRNVLNPLVRQEENRHRIIPFFEAVSDLYEPEAEVADVAERMAEALAGPEAAGLKGHMWALVSYIAGMIDPQRYIFVKPSAANNFFKLLASEYRRPKQFSGRAYREFLEQSRAIAQELRELGYPPRDMIDLQTLMWVTTEGAEDDESEDERSYSVRELLKEAVTNLQASYPEGVTNHQIRAYLDQHHPRQDGRPWSGSMVIPGDFALWGDTLQPCNASSAGDPNYPKFLVRPNRSERRYRLARPDEKEQPMEVANRRSSGLGAHFREQRGLWVSDEVIATYALALKTKPFAILTGISGTGKTKIAQILADFLSQEDLGEVSEAPPNTEDTFYVRMNRTLANKGFIYIRTDLHEYFELPARGSAVDLPMTIVGGPTFTARLNNIGSSRELLDVRLSIRDQKARDWLVAHVPMGGLLEVKVRGRRLSLDYMPSQRKVKQGSRHAFVSVRPDWTDNRGLLGYYNPLTETYVTTDFLKLLLRAARDPQRPYFVILDEMNLARVEHYFSDFLSCLESRLVGADGSVRQEPLALHDQPDPIEIEDMGDYFEIPGRLEVPLNVYFTGTVNVDETTYMFSPKVLDRANTIEFNHVDLDRYGGLVTEETSVSLRLYEPFELGSVTVASRDHYDALSRETKATLSALNGMLGRYHLHFGYRVANEMALYLHHAAEYADEREPNTVLDLQIVQKVLPKLHGARARMERPLVALLAFCATGKVMSEADALAWEQADRQRCRLDERGRLVCGEGYTAYPRAGAKVLRMLQIAREQGYTSFVV